MTTATRQHVELPPLIEHEFQRARRRLKCSREDFYSGFIAALRVRSIMHVAGQLIDEYDDNFDRNYGVERDVAA